MSSISEAASLGLGTKEQLEQVMRDMDLPTLVEYFGANASKLTKEQQGIAATLIKLQAEEVKSKKDYADKMAIFAGQATESGLKLANAGSNLVKLGVMTAPDLAAVDKLGFQEVVNIAKNANNTLTNEQRDAVVEYVEARKEELDSYKEYSDKMAVFAGKATESGIKLANAGAALVDLGIMTAPDLAAVGKMSFQEIINIAKNANGTLNKEQRDAVVEYVGIRKEELDSFNEYTDKLSVLSGKSTDSRNKLKRAGQALVDTAIMTSTDLVAADKMSFEQLLAFSHTVNADLNKDQRDAMMNYLDIRKEEIDSLREFNSDLSVLSGKTTQHEADIDTSLEGMIGKGVIAKTDKSKFKNMDFKDLIAYAEKQALILDPEQRESLIDYIRLRAEDTSSVKEEAMKYVDAFKSLLDAIQIGLDGIKDRMKELMGDDIFIGSLETEAKLMKSGGYDKLSSLRGESALVGDLNKETGDFSKLETSQEIIENSNRYLELQGEIYTMKMQQITKEREAAQSLHEYTQELYTSMKERLDETLNRAKEFGLSLYESMSSITTESKKYKNQVQADALKTKLSNKYDSTQMPALKKLLTSDSESKMATSKSTFMGKANNYGAAASAYVTLQGIYNDSLAKIEKARLFNESASPLAKQSDYTFTARRTQVEQYASDDAARFSDITEELFLAAEKYKSEIESNRDVQLTALNTLADVELAGIDKKRDEELKLFDTQRGHYSSLTSLIEKVKSSIENIKRALDPKYAEKELAKIAPFIAGITSASLSAGIKNGTFTKDDMSKLDKYHDLVVETTNQQVDAMKQLFDVTKQMNDWLNNLVFSEYGNANAGEKVSTAKSQYETLMGMTNSGNSALSMEAMQGLTSSSEKYLSELKSYYANVYDPNATDNTKELQLQQAEMQFKRLLDLSKNSTDNEEKMSAQQGLAGASEQYLKVLREFYASGDEYQSKYAEVTGNVRGVMNANKDVLGITKDNAPMMTATNTEAIKNLQQATLDKLEAFKSVIENVPETKWDDKQYEDYKLKLDTKFENQKTAALLNTATLKEAVDAAAIGQLLELKNVTLGASTTEEVLRKQASDIGGIFKETQNYSNFIKNGLMKTFDDTSFAQRMTILTEGYVGFLREAQISYTTLYTTTQQTMVDTLVRKFGEAVLAIDGVRQAVNNTSYAVATAAADIVGARSAEIAGLEARIAAAEAAAKAAATAAKANAAAEAAAAEAAANYNKAFIEAQRVSAAASANKAVASEVANSFTNMFKTQYAVATNPAPTPVTISAATVNAIAAGTTKAPTIPIQSVGTAVYRTAPAPAPAPKPAAVAPVTPGYSQNPLLNMMAAAAGVKKFADGGFVTKPTYGVFGEAGPEVLLPYNKYLEITNKPIKELGIPMLAEGGIATRPLLAMIGEGAEPEAVVPLSKLEEMRNPRDISVPHIAPPVTQVVVVNQGGDTDDGNDEELAELKRQNETLREQNDILYRVVSRLDESNKLAAEQVAVTSRTSENTVSAINKLNNSSSKGR